MKLPRRRFMAVAAGGVAAGLVAQALPVQPALRRRFKAIAFDAFPIFDPRPIFMLAEELFPGQGDALGAAWRTRQFEYTWLRTLSQRYVDFEQTTSDALTYAAHSLRLELNAARRQRLIEAYFQLKAWPDVLPVLTALKNAGMRLGFLSNFTPRMLEANLRNAGLTEFFEQVLSTDRVRAFKPDPRAYGMALEAFGLPREDIVFAAFAGWDAAGAKAFGYPTFWVNRQNASAEELGSEPDAVGGLADLAKFTVPSVI